MASVFTTVSPSNGVVVVRFPEQVLGGSQSVELAAHVRAALADDATTIIFDLEPVEFMNSTGLGLLVASLATIRQSTASLQLMAVPASVQSLLQITQLSQVFSIVESA
ncbi:MAG: STAS domain-containing protein [Candidatus Kapaibacteriota bacterium]|jgi:anti-anti-sigma factor